MFSARCLSLVILCVFYVQSADNRLEFIGPFDRKKSVMEFFQLYQIGTSGQNIKFRLEHLLYISIDQLRLSAQCKGTWKVAFTQKELDVIRSSSGKHLDQEAWNIVKDLMKVAKVNSAAHAEMPLHK